MSRILFELNNILNWILGKSILNRILNESFLGKIQTLNWIRLGIGHHYCGDSETRRLGDSETRRLRHSETGRHKPWIVTLPSLFPYLRRIAIEDIKKVFTQGPYGVHQAYWVCQNWQRVEVPIILRLPMTIRMIKVVAMMLLRLRMTVRMAMIMPMILTLRFY